MSNVSRPLIALLVATVAFFALWTIALKPKSSESGGGSSHGAGAYQSAIDKAHQAVGTANHASGVHGGTVPTSTRTTPPTTTTRTTTTPPAKPAATGAEKLGASAPAAGSAKAQSKTASTTEHARTDTATAAAAAQQRFDAVVHGLRAHKVVALLFYNDGASDDRAVKEELATVPEHGGKVVKVAVPLSELGSYQALADQADVNSTPTLVLIDHAAQATTLVGYASTFEIAHRIGDALAAGK